MPDLKSVLTKYVDANTPTLQPSYEPFLGRVRKRRTRRIRWMMGGSIAAAVAVVAAVVVPILKQAGSGDWITTAPSGRTHHTGAVPSGQAASCAYAYSPRAVSQYTDFAFDGTVTGVGRHPSDQFYDLPVRLHVNAWFRGGPAHTVVLDMPLSSPETWHEDAAPPVTVGTRLLVSGKTPTANNSLHHHAVAWSCGFSRYYDPQTAAAWRSAITHKP